jgi:hypothetical protein
MKLVTRSFAVRAAFVVGTWILLLAGTSYATFNRSVGDIRHQSRNINTTRSLGHST